jgi:hypothetical protein
VKSAACRAAPVAGLGLTRWARVLSATWKQPPPKPALCPRGLGHARFGLPVEHTGDVLGEAELTAVRWRLRELQLRRKSVSHGPAPVRCAAEGCRPAPRFDERALGGRLPVASKGAVEPGERERPFERRLSAVTAASTRNASVAGRIGGNQAFRLG